MASIESIPEELKNKIVIPVANSSNSFFLGPMGNPDPSEVIVTETNRVPFKQATMSPEDWDKKASFRNWPTIIPGWRNWFVKVASKKRADWSPRNLDQCISLSLSNMKKNEPLLRAVSYFWSSTYNAFLFGHGPMTPTLADIHMLTGLNITGTPLPHSFLIKPSYKFDSTRTGGWSSYITTHNSAKKSVDDREHAAFLNMWLDRYLFCGQACSPTFNYQVLAEKIAVDSEVPLGKYLLGALYHLLNQVSQHLLKNETVPTITGPWWLLQLWLNLYMQKTVTQDLRSLKFPVLTFLDEQEKQLSDDNKTHRCTSFGEAASAILTDESVSYFFKLFYKEVRHGREKPPISYEFYYPSKAARQMGFSQLPPALFFANKLKPREAVPTAVEFSRILQFEQALPAEIITEWDCQSFSSSAFDAWWQEWLQHLFSSSVSSYCSTLEPDFQENSEDLVELSPPEVAYQQWCPFLRLGWNAPSFKAVIKKKVTDILDDQPISSLIHKGTGSSKRLAKKPMLSRTKSKKTSASETDEQYLKSLADAAIETAAQDSDFEEEAPHSDPIGDLSPSSEEDANLNKSPGPLQGNQPSASSSAVPDQNVIQDEQEQSSSPYIPFTLEDYTKEEIVSAPKDTTVSSLFENVKNQLQLLIPYLETDTAILVQDAEAIRNIFNSIKNELPPQLTEILKPVAFIEFHEPKFSGAQSRLAAREAQKNLPTQEQQCVENMISVKKIIDQLKDSPAKINQKLTTLNEEKEQLLSKLRTVEAAFKHEEENLARIPSSLSEQKKLMSNLRSELQGIKIKKKNPVPGTADEDNQQIADVDSVRLKVLDLVKSVLNM